MNPLKIDGAFLVNKPAGITSFGVIDELKFALAKRLGVRSKFLPKLGHGGTLDPFAEGVLVVLVGKSVKLARHFLGSRKTYAGVIRFGETTRPGDPTDPISETTDVLPTSLEAIQTLARQLTLQDYLQIPPMHSAKKLNGKPLYELARKGIEVEREPKTCKLFQFNIESYLAPDAKFTVECSAGTYIRVLAQDMGRLLGSLGYLQSLTRTACGSFTIEKAISLADLKSAIESDQPIAEFINSTPSWIPFSALLPEHTGINATRAEADALAQGKQFTLQTLIQRAPIEDHSNTLTIFHQRDLIAIAGRANEQASWKLENVFTA